MREGVLELYINGDDMAAISRDRGSGGARRSTHCPIARTRRRWLFAPALNPNGTSLSISRDLTSFTSVMIS